MIGDVLTTSILFEALKEKYPNAELHYLINTHTYPVVENNPFITKFIFFTPEIEKSKRQFYRFLKHIKSQKYDAVVDVYGKLSSHLISWFANADQKIGYDKVQSRFIFNSSLKRRKSPVHNASLAIENRMLLLEPLDVPFNVYEPKIYLRSSETNRAKIYLESQGIQIDQPLFMISVLGSSLAKTYPFEYMAKLLDTIVKSEPRAQILFNYIPKQEPDARAIYDACETNTQQHIYFDVYGKSLREFLAITAHCTALIGNEGGANNMAKALNIKTFTIFSPYLNKQNWFGERETKDHMAIHLSDYVSYDDTDKKLAKKDPESYYLKLKPEFIIPELQSFLSNFE